MTITNTSPGTGRFARFALAAKVVETRRLSPNVALIRFEVTGLGGSFCPGDKVKLAVAGGAPKSYTPARVKGETLDIVFDLHGNGLTALWAESAKPGDVVWTTQPLRSLQVPSGRLWFEGDATTLGLAVALHEDPRYRLSGVVALDPADADAVQALGLPLRAVPLRAPFDRQPEGVDVAVIVGEASFVASGYKAMKGLGIGQICSKPYWSLRGRVHRKWVAMTTRGAQ